MDQGVLYIRKRFVFLHWQCLLLIFQLAHQGSFAQGVNYTNSQVKYLSLALANYHYIAINIALIGLELIGV